MTQQKDDIIKFLQKLLAGLMLLAMFFGSSLFVMFYYGEFIPVDKVIERQVKNNDVLLYGTLYGNQEMYYKWQMVLKKAPKIVVFGLSKAYQFRAAFFKDKNDFFNASAQYSLDYYLPFLKTIQMGKEPKIIIMTIDHILFNTHWNNQRNLNDFKKDLYYNTTLGQRIKAGSVGVQKNILFENILPKLFKGRPAGYIGLSASLNETGVRKDGSYSVNMSEIKRNTNDRFREVFRQIDRGELTYMYSETVSTRAVAQLDELLEYCKSRNIYVVGILPPYPHAVLETMKSMKTKYEYLSGLDKVLSPVFNKYSFGFYDFTDITKTGSTDKETYDGSHGSEKNYLRMMIMIARQNSFLRQYVDIDYLENRLKTTDNDFIVFGMNE